MSTSQVDGTIIEHATELLSEGLAEVFRKSEVGDVFASDVFFDLNMPVWRFQLEGPEAFEGFLRELNPDGVELSTGRAIVTASGFVVEHQDRKFEDGHEVTSRKLLLCEVREGRITEVVVYCSGEWDEELRARHAAEAPMIRP
jgi:ketosteroid isomerase-like protein